jgi:hypothetical protein
MTTTIQTLKKWDGLSRTYREVIISNGFYCLTDGTRLYRIETKGRTGRSLYSNGFYLNHKTGKENPVHGMDGPTGRGWGGQIVGYATKQEIESNPVKIKQI